MSLFGLLLLPPVMVLGALHFVILFLTRLFGLKHAEITTWRHLLSLDVYANTLLGGDHRETISSRLGRNTDCRLCKLACRFLNLFDKDHCEKSTEAFLREYYNDRHGG